MGDLFLIKEKWIKETARDLIAFGSIPFFILVLVRVLLLSKPVYFYQFIVAGVIFLILTILFRSNLYSGLSLIVLFFTCLYYQEIKFTIFGSLVYLGLLASLFYLKEKKERIFKGIFFGVLSSAISQICVGLVS